MKTKEIAIVLAALAIPAALSAQLKTSTSVAIPTASVSKTIALADFVNVAGTSLTAAATYMGIPCGSGCIVAKAAAGASPSVSIHLASGKTQASEVRTGIIISHETTHLIDVLLNGSSIVGLLCNGKGTLTVTPRFSGMGGTAAAYAWQLLDGGKLVKSGYGSEGSEGIIIDASHIAGAMQLAISDKGVISLEHGTQRLILTPDAKDAIGAKTGGYLRFEDLGLRVAGPAEFGVANTTLKTGVQPPSV